jgi:hypothetical protein
MVKDLLGGLARGDRDYDPRRGTRVLFVEDEAKVAGPEKEGLEWMPHEVAPARTGEGRERECLLDES